MRARMRAKNTLLQGCHLLSGDPEGWAPEEPQNLEAFPQHTGHLQPCSMYTQTQTDWMQVQKLSLSHPRTHTHTPEQNRQTDIMECSPLWVWYHRQTHCISVQQKVVEYSDLDSATVLVARVHNVVSVPTALNHQTHSYSDAAQQSGSSLWFACGDVSFIPFFAISMLRLRWRWAACICTLGIPVGSNRRALWLQQG